MRRALVLLLVVLLLPAGVPPAGAASTACGPGRTALGGSLLDAPEGTPLNAMVGVELTDGGGRAYDVFPDRVDEAGRPSGTRYSLVDAVNPELRPRAFADRRTRRDRTWGAPRAEGPLCFVTNPRITQAFLEVYPRRPMDDDGDGRTDRMVTDRSRHGAAAHYRQPVRAGEDNLGIALRLPRRLDTQVGFLHGYITYRGQAVPVAAPGCGTGGRPPCHGITAVRVFPGDANGPACGIEGFSASADGLDPTARGGTATYYRVDAIAGGRCGAASQSYAPRVTCVSFCGPGPTGGPSRTIGPGTSPAVRSGQGTQADISFG